MIRTSPLERAQAAVARRLLALPPAVVRRLAGPPVTIDGHTLDPQVQLILRVQRLAGRQPVHALDDVAAARRELELSARVLAPAAPPMASVEDRALAGLPVRLYRPRGVARPAPAVVWLHGGGHVVGSLESHDVPCRLLADAAACVVIAVDYRLAPEHPFPAAVDDATAAFQGVVAQAGALGIDPARIAVGGDSAGANAATVVALDTRADPARPALQVLVYPVVDLTMSSPSIRRLGRGFFLEEASIAWYRARYLAGADPRHPRASPWFVDDLTGLPPAVVVTAGFDPLRDEGDAWAARLQHAGVPVTHLREGTLFHGFWNATGGIGAAREAFDRAARAVRAGLAG